MIIRFFKDSENSPGPGFRNPMMSSYGVGVWYVGNRV
jgi:hypothetical protein